MAQLCSRCDTKKICHSCINFKDILYILTAKNSCLIFWLGVGMDFLHDPFCIRKDHIKRNQSVFHPKTYGLFGIVDKEHSRKPWKRLNKHQPPRTGCWRVDNIDPELGLSPSPAKIHVLIRTFRVQDPCQKAKEEAEAQCSTADSQGFTSVAINPRFPETVRRANASPGCKSARPDRRKTSMCKNTSSLLPNRFANPKPLA